MIRLTCAKKRYKGGKRCCKTIIYAKPLSNPTSINNVVISPQTYFTTPLKHREELEEEEGLKNKTKKTPTY